MAYTRNICTRATLFARRFNPSCTYISHHRNDEKKTNENPAQTRSYGAYRGNYSGPGSVIHRNSILFSGIGNGVGGYRFMSSSIGDGVDKSEFLSDVTGVMSDVTGVMSDVPVPVDVIASQTPVMSEVAIAAAESAIPVAALQYLIDGVHSFTGLNWAASIALTTLCIRGATIPFLIGQLKSTQKLSLMRPRLEEIKLEMDAKGDDPNAMQEGKQKMNALFREYGVTPFTPLKGMLIQGPIFISFFLAIRNMAEKVPSFKEGGAFWFTDLSTPDALYIFPVMTAVTFLITVEFNMQEGLENNPIAGTMKKFSRGLAVLTVPFTMSFPKALFCYWVTSNIFSFTYGSVLKLPAVKKALGIPDMPPPPPSNTNPGAQSGFSLLQALKQAAASRSSTAIPAASGSSTAIPAASESSTAIPPAASGSSTAVPPAAEESKPAGNGKTSSSSAVLSQRIKTLERQVKQRKKISKR